SCSIGAEQEVLRRIACHGAIVVRRDRAGPTIGDAHLHTRLASGRVDALRGKLNGDTRSIGKTRRGRAHAGTRARRSAAAALDRLQIEGSRGYGGDLIRQRGVAAVDETKARRAKGKVLVV